MKNFLVKFKESTMSILPVVVIVLMVACTPFFNLKANEIQIFLESAFGLIVGVTLFSLGAELSMTPMGEYTGTVLIKTKKFVFIILVTLLMGFLITISEPDLLVLSQQVKDVISTQVLIGSVGIGVGIFLVITLLKVIFNRQLATLLLLFYMLIFALSALLIEIDEWKLLPLSFDSGGVTTGPMTVPFIMAFGIGVAQTLGGKHGSENSFGFVSMCSVGPILVVLLLIILTRGEIKYELPDYSLDAVASKGAFDIMLIEAINVFRALSLIFIFFMLLNIFIIKLPVKKILQIIIGLITTFAGIVTFLTAATIGFIPIGFSLGTQIIKADPRLAVALCFIIGMTVVIAEPAIHVLTSQVEKITGGTVSRKSMLIALSLGVGISLALSMVRVIKGFSLIFYLIPGYFVSLALSLFVPPLYTSIAFDSGGVASGPLTSTFLVPFMIGACVALSGVDNVLEMAFGVVAMVAMTPLISIQLLGFKSVMAKVVRDRISMNRILRADDNQIVYFE